MIMFSTGRPLPNLRESFFEGAPQLFRSEGFSEYRLVRQVRG